MPAHISRGNGRRSAMRSCVEHVFAEQKHRMALSIRTIGIKRAEAKVGTSKNPLCSVGIS